MDRPPGHLPPQTRPEAETHPSLPPHLPAVGCWRDPEHPPLPSLPIPPRVTWNRHAGVESGFFRSLDCTRVTRVSPHCGSSAQPLAQLAPGGEASLPVPTLRFFPSPGPAPPHGCGRLPSPRAGTFRAARVPQPPPLCTPASAAPAGSLAFLHSPSPNNAGHSARLTTAPASAEGPDRDAPPR